MLVFFSKQDSRAADDEGFGLLQVMIMEEHHENHHCPLCKNSATGGLACASCVENTLSYKQQVSSITQEDKECIGHTFCHSTSSLFIHYAPSLSGYCV